MQWYKPMIMNNNITPFSDEEYKEFTKFIYNHAGINLTEKKRSLVFNRLRKKVIEHKLTSFGEYFKFAKNSNDELVNMINSITTNVTSLFRDMRQFVALTEMILPKYAKERRQLKIWSAGCSSGEEPYSIAIQVLKYKDPINFEILASDLSTKVLKIAGDGLYSEEAIKNVEKADLTKYFKKEGQEYRVNPEVKKYIKFSQINLMGPNFPSNLDIIFCRNVVIYFDAETKSKLFSKFYNSLKSDGYLFLGHSESLFNNPNFKFVKPSIYQKV